MLYARFRNKSSFYKRGARAVTAYGVSASKMRSLNLKESVRTNSPDEVVDMRSRERLEMLEAIRHPRERDFYQDHTYHNQWIARDLEPHQKKSLVKGYKFMAPNYEINPWLWYPGDTVEVMQGESRGQRGTIIAVVKYKNEIVVQNVNVRDVTIPATETRPEQIVQREHPIDVTRVAHVDPTTNEPCHIRLVTVRNKETGKLEEKRVSMTSGVLLPIPPRDETLDVGDPLKDTPLQDAEELTYDIKAEQDILVQRKLKAMEAHFVKELQNSYEYHRKFELKNAKDMRFFQRDVVRQASKMFVNDTFRSAANSEAGDSVQTQEQKPLPTFLLNNPWLMDELEPEIEEIEELRQMRAAEARVAAGQQAAATPTAAATATAEEDEEFDDDDDEFDEEEQEVAAAVEGADDQASDAPQKS